jgi:putative sigma-54 modulation protein
MDFEITVRHHELPERIKNYAANEVKKLGKIFDKIVTAKIIIDKQKDDEIVELAIHISGKDFIAKENGAEITKLIDSVVDKVGRQLKRYKEKRKNH